MARVVVTSTLLVVLFTALRLIGVETSLLQPFASACLVFGVVTLYLALLIIASSFYPSDTPYLARQGVVAVALTAGLFIGYVYHLDPIRNGASTFLVMFLLEKSVEIPGIWKGWRVWVLLLLTSILLYILSLFLRTHPGWVFTIFDASYITGEK